MKPISTQELINHINTEKVTILEILPMAYFKQGHLPGAVQAEVGDIVLMINKLGLNSQSPIITYCASETCPNSHQAASVLEANGFMNVKVYAGGKKEWLELGLNLIK